jgi:hypothetical protein
VEYISKYTAEDAINDGSLLHPYPERWPWLLITIGIHAAINEVDDGRTYEQKLVPLLQDCIMQVQRLIAAAKRRGEEPNVPVKLHHTVAGTVWILPNDKGGMTILFPSEY